MDFHRYRQLEGKHAYLSPSQYHWINYSDEKFEKVYHNLLAKERGTKLHDLAKRCIELRVTLPSTTGDIFGQYVNDAIGYGLTPEVTLYYSENCFGTADAIGYDGVTLRIFDLKTGTHKASMTQLKLYAALFYLEYGYQGIFPQNSTTELRLYQTDMPEIYIMLVDEIKHFMDIVISRDQLLNQLKGD